MDDQVQERVREAFARMVKKPAPAPRKSRDPVVRVTGSNNMIAFGDMQVGAPPEQPPRRGSRARK